MTGTPSVDTILDRQWCLLVGGRLVPAASGRFFDDESPVTEEVIAAVPYGGAAEVAAAVDAAVPAAAQ
jgi:acyl-CoA reductase-like NAD-dependent aldehyde dehydrogenase